MRLIFLGDINVTKSFKSTLQPTFDMADIVVANLEGPIVSEDNANLLQQKNSLVLYNSIDAFQVLESFNVTAVSLANNHILDLPLSISKQKTQLGQSGISSFGGGSNATEASNPYSLSRGDSTVQIFAFGWDVIGCRTTTGYRQGVNPLTAAHALDTIRRLRSVDTSSFVAFIMHWNYELELYPQPAHRQLAQDLIREGVDAVIGLHPHVAQGAELFEGKPIVYSLGNWFFPARELGHFRLAYPPVASRQLALELEMQERTVNKARFHWYRFDQERSSIHFVQSESWDGEILQSLTPYAGMTHEEYIRWFRKNRRRRSGLPVYSDYRHAWRNRVKDRWVKLRQAVIETLVRLRLKGGPR
jgi:poly-gamma-glutamate synthesis protein (capsule biosynthesis protein)